MKHYVIIFFGVLMADILYVGYLQAVQSRKILLASCWASLITATSGLIIINYTSSFFSILSAVGGAFVGTYISMKYFKR